MSLKAKVEAVVYAAEEPVTLAQLAAIFADEVLQELAAAAAQSAEFPEFADTGDAHAGSEEASIAAEDPIPPDLQPAADEKKAARQRDRQVREQLERILNLLIGEYAEADRGMEIKEIAGGYRMATKAEYHDAVRGFVKSLKPPMKLSLQALETLAVIAYKQPVTGPEVSEIRGVDSGGVLASLIGRKLIATAGRKQVIGRPILYKTTKEFLLRFGLKDVNELPSIEEFEKMAGELAESESEADDAAMRSSDLPFAENESTPPLASSEAEDSEGAEWLEKADAPEEESSLSLPIAPSPPEEPEEATPPGTTADPEPPKAENGEKPPIYEL